MSYLPFGDSKTNDPDRPYWDDVMNDELSQTFFETLKKWFDDNGENLVVNENGFSIIRSQSEKVLRSFLAIEKIRALPRYEISADFESGGIRIDPVNQKNKKSS